MAYRFGSSLAALGFLRLGLFTLVILDLLLPGAYLLAGLLVGEPAEPSAWTVIPTLIAPVMAPILLVVILFDYTMSRIRAADEQGDARNHFLDIGRLDLMFIGLLLLYWVPFFLTL